MSSSFFQPKLFLILLLNSACAPQIPSENKAIPVEPKKIPTSEMHPQKSKLKWREVLYEAPWPKSYNFQMFSFRESLWVFHPRGTWKSKDGKVWLKSPLDNSLGNLAFLDYVTFGESILGLGHFTGNIEQFQFTPKITRTKDGATWETLSEKSTLPERFFYHPIEFKNKLWIFGGETASGEVSGIWNSSDGIHWKEVESTPSFGKRGSSQVVAFHDSLYLFNNDIWRSGDGLNWDCVTKKILPEFDLFGYSVIVFHDQLWLIGCNRNGLFSSAVGRSRNGVEWVWEEAPWSPRGGVALAVYENKLWMTGGKYGGLPNAPNFVYSNDLWALEESP
ncbi:MAG: hypothetical protein SFU91_15325 [Chloroherpetonaceae bacterium]|nr:hypothetical protein [Chloroherpetonaceae bacterium]